MIRLKLFQKYWQGHDLTELLMVMLAMMIICMFLLGCIGLALHHQRLEMERMSYETNSR